MLSTSKDKSVVGLDIEAGSVAAAQVAADGSREVQQVAIAPLEGGLIKEGEVMDPEALSAALRTMFTENKLSKSVRLGVANQRVAVRVLNLPLIEDPAQLETAVRFQVEEELPMPLDQAVLDHQVVSRFSGEDGTRGMQVIAVAARRDMIDTLLSSVRGAGLRPLGIDLSAFAMIRALAGDSSAEAAAVPAHEAASDAASDSPSSTGNGAAAVPAHEAASDAASDSPSSTGNGVAEPHVSTVLYCNLGDVTNLAVARGSTCLFTRISPFGVELIAARLAERRSLAIDHARQWLVHVGLEQPTFEIEGDPEIIAATRETLDEGAGKLADELRLSLEFYAAQEGVPPAESIVVSGPGSTIPGLVERLQAGLGQPVSTPRPDALLQLGEGAAARLIVSYGLALED